jgi:hypothetical protein
MLLYIVVLCAIVVFFRQELGRIFKKFDNKYYLNVFILLLTLSFLNIKYHYELIHFFRFISYNINHIRVQFSRILLFFHINSQNKVFFIYLFPALIYFFCLYFPEYYRKKYPSQIYAEQVWTVKVAFYLFLILLMMIFSLTIH